MTVPSATTEAAVGTDDPVVLFSAAAVVLMHTAAQDWSGAACTSGEWRTMAAYDALVRWPVPVFVMISGALFLNPKRKVTVYHLWSKKIPRILTAFLFWSVIYALYNYLTRSNWSLHTFLMAILTGYYHMWFLFMIIGLYLVTPLMRKIAEDRRMLNYFLVLSMIFGFLIPTIRHQILPFSLSCSYISG